MEDKAKKSTILFTIIAALGLLHSGYELIEKGSLVLIVGTVYYLALVILCALNLQLKRTLFLRVATLLTLPGLVFFLFGGAPFYAVVSVALFLIGFYSLINIPRGGVVCYPNPVLRRKARKVSAFEMHDLMEKMMETLKKEDGAGIAAPQVGVSQRVIMINTGEGISTFINPVVTPVGSDRVVSNEGCLSLRGVWADVERHYKVMVEAYNKEGEKIFTEAEGMIAIIIQHEADHLDGVLFIDHLPLKKKIKEILKYYFREYIWQKD